jgi:hypothetical protein
MTEYPSPVIEPVQDSSRYFAMMIENEQGIHGTSSSVAGWILCTAALGQSLAGIVTGKRAFIGIGFQERNDSFDFSAAVQDHYRYVAPLASVDEWLAGIRPFLRHG